MSTANKRLNSTWIPQPFLSEEGERTLGMRLDESTVDFHKCGRLVYRDYFMVGECVRFLFTSCEESKTNE